MIAHLLFVLLLAQSAPPADPKCNLEGQVISANTGAPLKHASLRLSPAGPASPDTPRTEFTSSTDAEGKFVMQNVDAGTYTLRAERTGYVSQAYGARSPNSGGTQLKLESGQSMKDLLFKLVPQAMIFGKVVDDDGDGVPNARIQCQRGVYVNGKKQLVPAGSDIAQADGSFVMRLPSGRVILSADPPRNVAMGMIERAVGKVNDSLLTTYFPNSLDLGSAAPIELTPGAELRGIEIHMRRGRLHDIRGHVQNASSGPMPDGLNLMLMPKDDPYYNGRNQIYLQGKSGAFQFKNVLPGAYIIMAPWAQSTVIDASGESRTMQLTARVEVSIGDMDLENVIVPLGPGLDIAGAIKPEAGQSNQPPQQSQQQSPPSYRVSLQTVDGPRGYGGEAAQASDEGNFRLHGVMPAKYRVNVIGTPDGSYVKTIRFGGEDITGKDLDLTSGSGGELEIVISPNAADVTGVVRNEDGDAMPGVQVQIFEDNDLKHTANTDQNGGFHFTSLAPGNYRVYAWEDIQSGLSQDPDFRKNFDSQAATVKLEEKGHESIEVKLIPKDAIETEAAKIQ